MSSPDPSRQYPERPFVGVGIVVLKDEAVLLIRRGQAPRYGQWSLPGGIQETGETVFEAARRELMEETAVEIGDPVLVDIVDAIRHDSDGRVEFHYTLIDVAAHWRAGAPAAGSDAMDAQWIAISDSRALDMWDETHRVIEKAVEVLGAGQYAGKADANMNE